MCGPSRRSELARWLVDTVDAAIAEIYVADLLEDKVLSTRDLTDPSDAVHRATCCKEGVEHRRLHHRYARSRDHKRKRADLSGDEHWVARARTHLFRSKRALALATYLRARGVLKEAFGQQADGREARGARGDGLRQRRDPSGAEEGEGRPGRHRCCGHHGVRRGAALQRAARWQARGDVGGEPGGRARVPSSLLGAESEIASSMAGRAIVRAPTLVLLGTTSLYGVGSSQYNRIKIPADRLGGADEDVIRYEELGALGGVRYFTVLRGDGRCARRSRAAVDDGQRVNSIFGEGVSPKLRKVQAGARFC